MTEKKRSLWILMVVALVASPAAAQQLEEEDLAEPDVWEEIKPNFARAEEVFNSAQTSAQQRESIALFEEFLAGFKENSAFEEPSEEILELVVQALFMKAQAGFNVAETTVVDTDLRQILDIRPAFVMDRAFVSSRLVDRFEEIQRQRVGSVLVGVDPYDARVSSSRWQADDDGLLVLPIGAQEIRVQRPGYTSQTHEVVIPAGGVIGLKVILQRSAAVLTILSEEPDIEIYINGELRGATAASGADHAALSELMIADLQTGDYVLEARREGFRTDSKTYKVESLIDYRVGPIVLEPTSGTVVLQGFPAATVVYANGEIATPEFVGGADPRLTLSPGEYLLALEHPLLGVFETTVVIADLDQETVEVKLRPALAFLGALGGDRTTADQLLAGLGSSLRGLERWALLDRTRLGEKIVGDAEVTTEMLRSYAQTEQQTSIRWDEVQKSADDSVSASLYVLAVLSDDLLAASAEIFVWPAAPLPSRPDVFKVPLSEAGSNPQIAELDRSVLRRRSSIGATVVDSAVHGYPVVVQVNDNGSAARAGLRAGDEITSLDGVEISSVEQLRDELEKRIESHAESGRTVKLGLAPSGGERTLDLAIDLSPRIVGHREPGLLYAPAAYELWREAQSEERAVPKWIVDLNLAMVYLRGQDLTRSIQLLREVSVPTDGVLGPGMVDYFLGIALLTAGDEQAENARTFLSAAAERADARLYFEDGPMVAPRARARLQALE